MITINTQVAYNYTGSASPKTGDITFTLNTGDKR